MVADRLKALLAHVPDTSVREVERLAKLRRGYLQKIIDRSITNPGSEGIRALADVFGCTTDHLIRGAAPPTGDEVQAAVAAAAAAKPRRVKRAA